MLAWKLAGDVAFVRLRYEGTDILGHVEIYVNEGCNVELFRCDGGSLAGAPKSTKMKRSDENKQGKVDPVS